MNDPDPSAQLYGDGLTAAIAARLFADPPGPGADGKGLAPWQLRRVVEYLDAHLPERVDLAHLAALVGLSQSHFSRAFKASTGMAPYRWQLDARIRRAQALLIDTPRLARRGGRGDRLCRCGTFWADVPEAHRSDAGGVATRPEKLITIRSRFRLRIAESNSVFHSAAGQYRSTGQANEIALSV